MISIIIPVFNAKEHVKACVEAIMGQNVAKEIILINDGSGDGSKEICDEMAEKYEAVLVIHTTNHGVSHARNTGLDHAKGEYITFVDVDDRIEDGLFSVLLQDLEANNCDVSSVGYTEVYDSSLKEVEKFGTKKIYVWSDPLQVFLTDNKIFWTVWGKLYKKEVIGTIRFPEDKAIAEDMYFVYRICRACKKMVFRDESYYRYGIHEKSVMNQTIGKKNFDVPKLIDLVRKETIDLCPQKKAEAETFRLRFYIWFYRFILKKRKNDKSYEGEIESIRKGIKEYPICFAWKTQTKKYFLEYLLICNMVKLYQWMVKR